MDPVYATYSISPREVSKDGKPDEIVFNDKHHGMIIGQASGMVFNPRCDQVISRTVDNELVGGVVYSGYTGHSVAMHFAGFEPHWIIRDMIWVCFNYPFTQMGVKKIFAPVPSSNTLAYEMDLRWGFSRPTVLKDVFDDGDLIVLEMLKEECKWLKLKPKRFFDGDTHGRQE